MTAVKVWTGSAWVDSQITEKVWTGSAYVTFAPAGGPSYEAVTWGTTPSSTDNNDGGQAYNMGVRFSVANAKQGLGIRWRVPDTVSTPPGGTHAAGLYVDGGSRIAYQAFTPVPGGNQDILFTTPVTLSPGTWYVAGVYTVHYVFRSGSPSGLTSPSGNVVVDAGRLRTDNGGASGSGYPDQTFSTTYYVSPIVEV
jgi:hypothetical protein